VISIDLASHIQNWLVDVLEVRAREALDCEEYEAVDEARCSLSTSVFTYWSTGRKMLMGQEEGWNRPVVLQDRLLCITDSLHAFKRVFARYYM
jgi:hypothetical protein